MTTLMPMCFLRIPKHLGSLIVAVLIDIRGNCRGGEDKRDVLDDNTPLSKRRRTHK